MSYFAHYFSDHQFLRVIDQLSNYHYTWDLDDINKTPGCVTSIHQNHPIAGLNDLEVEWFYSNGTCIPGGQIR